MTLVEAFGLAMRGNPRHAGVDHQHRVGLREVWPELEAAEHLMIGRKAEVGGKRLHHRESKILGEHRERVKRLHRATERRRHDERILGLGENAGSLVDYLARRFRRLDAE